MVALVSPYAERVVSSQRTRVRLSFVRIAAVVLILTGAATCDVESERSFGLDGQNAGAPSSDLSDGALDQSLAEEQTPSPETASVADATQDIDVLDSTAPEGQYGGEPAESPRRSDPQPSSSGSSPPPQLYGGSLANELTVPAGFVAYRWADELFQPTVLQFSPDGRLFVAERFGQIWTLADIDGDGRAERRVLFAEGLEEPLTGLLVVDDVTVIASDRSRLIELTDGDADGVADSARRLLSDLPFGLHHSNGLALGPDGRLYFTVGSTCNDCEEADPRSATIQALDTATGELETIATGLRNAYDIVFTPDDVLWATDNGSDPPCATPDELNRIEAGRHYGWPYCSVDPRFGDAMGPELEFDLHASADGFVWEDLELYPPEWRRGFFVALFGTGAKGAPETGKRVQFAQLGDDGRFYLRDFATGFANPLDVALGPDGALYIADFGAGVIYRVLPRQSRRPALATP